MGAAASRPSPHLPAVCSFFLPKSTTRLFTIPGYFERLRMPLGTSLVFDTFYVLNVGYRLRVYPAGFDEESRDSVAVFLEQPSGHPVPGADSARVLIEILGGSGEERYTVFDNHTARSEQTTLANHAKGYVRFVKVLELLASSCVHPDDDSVTIQITVSVKEEITRPAAEVMEALSAMAAPVTFLPSWEPEVCGYHTLAIRGFSKIKAGLQAGECVHSTQFHLAGAGSVWYFKVYPNGRCDATMDCLSVFLGRGRSDHPATTAEFGFELVGLTEVAKVEFKKHTFDGDHPEDGFPCLVTSSDLASFEEVIRDDRVVVRCHLRLTNVATGRFPPAAVQPAVVTSPPSDGSEHHLKVPPTSPGIMKETENEQTGESVLAPLLNDMY
jgi:hypothetical protein